ncbi:glycosyl transferase family 1 [Agrobacterium rubi]|uniref:Glycosyltransferase family 4 protein n=2 Tax=Agrobacterium rubi TaxID=28099 RepID=A0AAE7R935_9HYPH|nr:glycosyl transferase family 1 [Agrobacterium rubi]MBP1878792.1 succinoglycan biosynthesis protein ExoL [Agrobacterium rubi]MCL6652849.1 glycosyl transferase family 1 [Agrobacterium rubi]NTE88587.1 glycosyltransferase family 4 protein [Agrobacterium rubi]NTF04415.1 glycosyltransferase family 4 protein [Agrobacterium rubi]NTF09948.1 glycosyltransferase family 4 protein [Agrobacterium rubi]
MTHVLYLAHDLADPAIRRRVMTLQAGGATVSLAGFTRGENKLATIDGITPIVLGETADGRFAQRIMAVVKSSFSLKSLLKNVTKPDVIIARNLEMLALSRRASSIYGREVPVVYECLDIHRLLLNEGPAGKIVNAAQRYFAKGAKLLITSSPAFVSQYFVPRSGLALPVLLQENKVLMLDGSQAEITPSPRAPKAGEPWKIGWFGALRCRKSLEILADFAKRMDGKVEIILRGRPAQSEFDDFDGFVANAPYLSFKGPYKNPEDLASIYNDVHFTWAIDFFEEGQNSSWLLPNRLYEGCLYGTLPIAVAGTETARFLEAKNIGHILPVANTQTLEALFLNMDDQAYLQSFQNLASIDRNQWVTDIKDCAQLVHKLASLAAPHNGRAVAAKLSTA